MDKIEKAFSSNGVLSCPYARSKFLNFMFHKELTKRLAIRSLTGIKTYAVLPPQCETNLKRHFPLKTFEGIIPGISADAVSLYWSHLISNQIIY